MRKLKNLSFGRRIVMLWKKFLRYRHTAIPIRYQLWITFMLVVLLPLGLVGTTSMIISYQSRRGQIIGQLESVATRKATEIKVWVRELHTDLSLALVGEESIKHVEILLAELPDPEAFYEPHRQLQHHFLHILQLTQRLDQLFIISRQGMVVVSTDSAMEHEFHGQQPYFKRGLQEVATYIQPLSVPPTSKEINTVMVVRPIISAQNEVLGVLGGYTTLARLHELMLEREGLGKTGETYLVDSAGILLTESRFQGVTPGGRLNIPGVTTALRDHSHGYGVYPDYRGVPVIEVYHWLPELQAILLAKQDRSEIFQTLYTIIAREAIFVFIMLLFAGAVLVFFTRRLAVPLANLAETAKRITAGEWDQVANVESADEIGVLADALNNITLQLRRRSEIEELISDISRKFVNLSVAEADQTIEWGLKKIGDFVGVDWSYMILFSKDGEITHSIYECHDSESEQPHKHWSQRFSVSLFPWFMKRMEMLKVLYIPQVETLPPDAAMEKEAWQTEGIRSLICIPIASGGTLQGFVGFDSGQTKKLWSGEDIRLLRMVGELICHILERKWAEEALRTSEVKYRRLYESMIDGFIRVDLNNTIVESNAAFQDMLGYPADEISQLTIQDVTPEKWHALEANIIKNQVSIRGYSELYEKEYQKKDGTLIPVELRTYLIRDKSGNASGMWAIVRDITERKQAEEKIRKINEELEQRVVERTAELQQSLESLQRTQNQLVQSEKMSALVNLVAGVAHEINTPVGVSVTAASHLGVKTKELVNHYTASHLKRSDLENYVKIAEESSKIILTNLSRAAELIRSFKQVAVDQSSEEKRHFQVSKYLDDILLSLRPKLKKTAHTITINCPEELEINTYPGAFSQIITNFIVNSLIHGFEEMSQGNMVIDISVENGTLLLTYRDDGKGIEPEHLPRIFEPFFTTKRAQSSSGLGMHIVYNLVTQKLGGTIMCESTPGVGVKFTIQVPIEPVR